MQQSGVWLGALWWAAGPWWGDVSSIILNSRQSSPTVDQYYQSIEPPSGPAIAQILPQALEPFL